MDHYLAREWVKYSTKDYDQFVQGVYQYTDKEIDILDTEFQFLYKNLKLFGWFFDYPTEHGIRKILTQFSKRIRFENDLANCMDIYLNNQEDFDALFASFLVDIKDKSVEFISKLDNKIVD
jgi:acyl carrier protein phosphodiesterase